MKKPKLSMSCLPWRLRACNFHGNFSHFTSICNLSQVQNGFIESHIQFILSTKWLKETVYICGVQFNMFPRFGHWAIYHGVFWVLNLNNSQNNAKNTRHTIWHKLNFLLRYSKIYITTTYCFHTKNWCRCRILGPNDGLHIIPLWSTVHICQVS